MQLQHHNVNKMLGAAFLLSNHSQVTGTATFHCSSWGYLVKYVISVPLRIFLYSSHPFLEKESCYVSASLLVINSTHLISVLGLLTYDFYIWYSFLVVCIFIHICIYVCWELNLGTYTCWASALP